MIFSMTQLIQWLVQYKYLVLFPIVVVEGPIITVIAGFLSSLGWLNIIAIYAVVVSGDLVGDSIYYMLGRWGRKGFIIRWGHYIGITMERMMQLEEYFKRHKSKTLIVGKLSHAVGAPILIAAGMARVPYLEFVGINFLATLPKSFGLLLIGYYFGQGYRRINRYLDYTALGMVALVILLVLIYFMFNRVRKIFFNKD